MTAIMISVGYKIRYDYRVSIATVVVRKLESITFQYSVSYSFLYLVSSNSKLMNNKIRCGVH